MSSSSSSSNSKYDRSSLIGFIVFFYGTDVSN